MKAWLAHHRRVFLTTLTELLANPVGSLLTWLVIGIALALPAILLVVLNNVSSVSGDWGGEPRISVYLARDLDVSAARRVAAELERNPEIERIRFISANDALKAFQHRSGFGEVLNSLDRNPLPHVLEIVPMTSEPIELSRLRDSIDARDEVERISLDLAWLERLFAILSFAERLVVALSVVLGLGVMLIMGNTIRLAIENRRKEIEVVKLVGGTDGFVRRPFLYLGFWYGFGGAIVAFLLLQVSLLFLSGPVELLAQSYRDDFVLLGPGGTGYLVLFLAGALLGILGAVIAVSRHLSEIEPQ